MKKAYESHSANLSELELTLPLESRWGIEAEEHPADFCSRAVGMDNNDSSGATFVVGLTRRCGRS